MLEWPEVVTLSQQLDGAVKGRTVKAVLPPSKPHKFCWFQGDPAAYDGAVKGSRISGAEGFGIFVELRFDNGRRLCFNDGVNVRLLPRSAAPKEYQLLVGLDDGKALVFTVAMYGGIILHAGDYDNEYYLKSRAALSPFAEGFPAYCRALLRESKPTLSLKAFLATEQRFPGIGNGVLQDILFDAGLHPKRKIGTLSQTERETLLASVLSVLREMTKKGGRDTEKNLFGEWGGYATRLSKKTLAAGCPRCGGELVKEAYLGGAVYYCPRCQPLSPPPGTRAAGTGEA